MQCLDCCANASNQFFGFKAGKTFGISLQGALCSGLCFASVVLKFLLNANTNSYAVSSRYTFSYYVCVMASAINTQKRGKNQPTFIFSKSKFANPFPLNTTNCLRLLSTLMVAVDIREVAAVVILRLFVCISFPRTARIHRCQRTFMRINFPAWFCFHLNHKIWWRFPSKKLCKSLFIIHHGKEQFESSDVRENLKGSQQPHTHTHTYVRAQMLDEIREKRWNHSLL